MTIKQQGGIFGRNPTFNDVEVEGTLTVNGEPISDFGTMAQQDADSVNIDGGNIDGTIIGASSAAAITGTTGTFNTSLDVNGDIEIGASGSGTKQVYVNGSGSSTSVMEVLMRGGGTGNPTTLLRHSSSTKAFNILTGNYEAEAARLTVSGTGSGDVTINTGNLVIGTSGKGIDFSATSGTGTSELFSDYEEGNWTPTLTSGPTLSAAVGRYTKVGNVVYVMAKITRNDAAANSNAFELGGLPYTPDNSNPTSANGLGVAASYNGSSDRRVGIINSSNVNTVFIVKTGTAVNVTYDNFIADTRTAELKWFYYT